MTDRDPNTGMRLGRFCETEDLALTDNLSTTPAYDKRNFAFGNLINNSGGSVTVAWYGSATEDGTYAEVTADGSTGASQTIGDGKSRPWPDEAAAMPYVKLVLSSGTATLNIQACG